MKKHILIVEDETDIASALSARLINEGFAVSVADNGNDGLELALTEEYDLAVLDIMLPGKDGLEIARILHEEKDTAILMLSARDEENDIVSGLTVGADDYVTKPFSLREVVARIHALLRRKDVVTHPRNTSLASTQFGDLTIDITTRSVTINNTFVHTTPTEFRLLCTLASDPRSVFSRDDLVQQLSHEETGTSHPNERTVDSHIRSLRKKIGAHYIRTVHSVGYSFEPEQENSRVSA